METRSVKNISKDTKDSSQYDDNNIQLLEIDEEGYVRSIKHLPIKEPK